MGERVSEAQPSPAQSHLPVRSAVDACLARGHCPTSLSAFLFPAPSSRLRPRPVVVRLSAARPPTMIAPITGKLRKRFWLDLTTALGLGVSAGYAFWSVLFALLPLTRHTNSPPSNRYGVHLKRGEHSVHLADLASTTLHTRASPKLITHDVSNFQSLVYSSATGGVLPQARARQAAGVAVNLISYCNPSAIPLLATVPAVERL